MLYNCKSFICICLSHKPSTSREGRNRIFVKDGYIKLLPFYFYCHIFFKHLERDKVGSLSPTII